MNFLAALFSASPWLVSVSTIYEYVYNIIVLLSTIIIYLYIFVALFHFMYTIFPFGVLYPEHMQLVLDCVVIAFSLESIRPGLVRGGGKAPNVVG